ncbi:fructokinase [Nitrosospira multiformis ATCC 25196]|uniref:Fructokinase n=1 Tax=Nitrosospira multiformis (strain ATCC 25196 / NCIMB 11849 / C 71) TaxID=323848 RepID=A0A1H5U433_NITMU|nr:carbohydrate kinase [Nitrosospira multiformis]SEF69796.1 fructokinase [Nitrosospira multiformis ATCC 25196]
MMIEVRHSVLLFGEILIDRFPGGDVLGGAPLNVACHLRAFGCAPVLVSRIGQDAEGARLLQTMESAGLSTHGIQLDSVYPTGVVAVHLGAEGHRFDIVPNQAYDHIHPRLARMAALAANPEMVYFGTLAQRADSHRALRHMLRATSGQRFFDVNLRDPWIYGERLDWSLRHADIVKANNDELDRIAQLMNMDEPDAETQARALIERYQLCGMLITCGGAGAWWLERGGEKISIVPDKAVDVVDTVGAGDAFSAVFMFGRLREWDMPLTLMRAQQFASAVCGIRGAIPEHSDFYEPFIRQWSVDG